MFINGTGRYAGMIGAATGMPDPRADKDSPGSTVWIGSYELVKE